MTVGKLRSVARIHADASIVGHIHVYIQTAVGIQTCSIVVDNGGVEHLCVAGAVVDAVASVSADGTSADFAGTAVEVDAVSVVADDAVLHVAVAGVIDAIA